jgi:hypothetical protein
MSEVLGALPAGVFPPLVFPAVFRFPLDADGDAVAVVALEAAAGAGAALDGPASSVPVCLEGCALVALGRPRPVFGGIIDR